MADINKQLEDLYKSEDFKQLPRVDDLVKATVVAIEKGEVYLDVDGIFTGVVRGKELVDESGRYSNLKIGDEVVATLIDSENEKGLLELSFRSAGHLQAWQNLEDLKASQEVVEVKVLSANKGGLLIQLDQIQGFLPVSQLSADNYPRVEGGNKNKILDKLKEFVNNKIKVKVLDVDEKEEKLIVSEKDVFAKEVESMLNQLKVGDVVDGRITAVVDFGTFIEFAIPGEKNKKMEGLVHISEMAWQRIDHPKDIVKVGDMVKAQVISIENGRVSLSMKKLIADPWQEATKKYKIGDKVEGKVLKLDNFGAFVELDQDIHGLAHISELSNDQISSPEEVVKPGENYTFTIVSIEPAEHRLGLSLINKPKKEKKEFDKEKKPAEEEKTEDKE